VALCFPGGGLNFLPSWGIFSMSTYIELMDMLKSIYQSLKLRARQSSPVAVYWSEDMKQALARYSDGFWAILDKESEAMVCFLDLFPGGKSGFALGASHEQIANLNMRSILETGGLVMNSDGSFWPSKLPDWVVIEDSEVQPGLDQFSKGGGFFGGVDFSELTASRFASLINSSHLPYLAVHFKRKFRDDMEFGVNSEAAGMFDPRSYNDYPVHIQVINKIFQLFDPKCLKFDKLINPGILDNKSARVGLMTDVNVRDFCKYATQKTFASIEDFLSSQPDEWSTLTAEENNSSDNQKTFVSTEDLLLSQLDEEVTLTKEKNNNHDEKLPSLCLSFNDKGLSYEVYDSGYDNQIVHWSYTDPDNIHVKEGGVKWVVDREVWCNENLEKYYGKSISYPNTYEDCITANISDILLVCDFLMLRHLLAPKPDEFKANVVLRAYDGNLESLEGGQVAIYYRFVLDAVVQHESGVKTAVSMEGDTVGETNIEITVQLPPTSCVPGNQDYENLKEWYKQNCSALLKSGFKLSSGLPDEIPFFRGKLQADYSSVLDKTRHNPRKNGKSGLQGGDY